MNSKEKQYDVAIAGGGVAGLVAAISCAQRGLYTVLIEKGDYPRHKVCGEYISKEVTSIMRKIGVHLTDCGAVEINRLLFSSTNGKSVKTDLPLGGLSISRYRLDELLYQKAQSIGIQLLTNKEVTSSKFQQNGFTLELKSKESISAKLFLSAVGKRSKLSFSEGALPHSDYLAVKDYYKFNGDWPKNEVALVNFPGGYCGISQVETGLLNVSYLVKTEKLKEAGSIDELNQQVLRQNPILKEFFSNSTAQLAKPMTISNIYFGHRDIVKDHVLYAGDASGMIYPLAGNGMAMGMSAGFYFSELADQFISEVISRERLETSYVFFWKKTFKRRLQISRFYQVLMGKNWGSNIAVGALGLGASWSKLFIHQTHGKN